MRRRNVFFLVAGALIAEFLILEETLGISLPSDRYSAVSRAQVATEGREVHFVTHNSRFTVVERLSDDGSRALVLRESFFMDREPDVEGPPRATVTVEGIDGGHVKWKFSEPGERGDAINDDLYRVVKPSNGETPYIYTYFSVKDGRKVLTKRDAELSTKELEDLERSLIK